MKALHDEIKARFPEVAGPALAGDAEDPYGLMAAVVGWLQGLGPEGLTPEIADRAAAFSAWCEDQPRGAGADDDVLTLWVIGFLEPLCRAASMRPLVPRLVGRRSLLANAAYLRCWVGDEAAAVVLRLSARPRRGRRPGQRGPIR